MTYLDLFDGWVNMEEFAAGSLIYSEKEPADVLYVILSGEVELTFHGIALGKEQTGGLIGEMAMINSATRNCSATALSDVSLARLNREQFRELLDRSSEFSFHAMATLAHRLRAVDRFISTKLE
ncbi:MAG: cyclic nucleotide-binding domain-containing protein [Xanthomonadales bacterium]|jgi:CRP-like cAMP-binding protein|nr:cyclic nucleotide-binding domain-containing protein [Xanthomonadales bacterium]